MEETERLWADCLRSSNEQLERLSLKMDDMIQDMNQAKQELLIQEFQDEIDSCQFDYRAYTVLFFIWFGGLIVLYLFYTASLGFLIFPCVITTVFCLAQSIHNRRKIKKLKEKILSI